MKLKKEIYQVIAGCCICDESAKVATERVIELLTGNKEIVRCVTCGSACHIYSGEEGTNSYESLIPFDKINEKV
jgi:hypothetical protein